MENQNVIRFVYPGNEFFNRSGMNDSKFGQTCENEFHSPKKNSKKGRKKAAKK